LESGGILIQTLCKLGQFADFIKEKLEGERIMTERQLRKRVKELVGELEGGWRWNEVDLHYASFTNNIELTKLFLSLGVEQTTLDFCLQTALFFEHYEIAKLAVAAGGNLHTTLIICKRGASQGNQSAIRMQNWIERYLVGDIDWKECGF
jgi:hypothetical protein